jgi:uncharacterized phage protein (TIGR01671 family)
MAYFKAKNAAGIWVEFKAGETAEGIDVKTISQCTGLNDSDGVPIYNGDILAYISSYNLYIYTIEFREGAFVGVKLGADYAHEKGYTPIGWEATPYKNNDYDSVLPSNWIRDAKIISNIHDIPNYNRKNNENS